MGPDRKKKIQTPVRSALQFEDSQTLELLAFVWGCFSSFSCSGLVGAQSSVSSSNQRRARPNQIFAYTSRKIQICFYTHFASHLFFLSSADGWNQLPNLSHLSNYYPPFFPISKMLSPSFSHRSIQPIWVLRFPFKITRKPWIEGLRALYLWFGVAESGVRRKGKWETGWWFLMFPFATLVVNQSGLMAMERFSLLAMSAIFLFVESAFSMILRKVEMFACGVALHLTVSSDRWTILVAFISESCAFAVQELEFIEWNFYSCLSSFVIDHMLFESLNRLGYSHVGSYVNYGFVNT